MLRRWERADEAALSAIWGDPEVWSALRPGAPFQAAVGAERLDHYLRHWEEHGFGLWAIVVRESGEVVGWSGPSHPTFVPQFAHEVEIGWTLRRPFWGCGLASEAAREAVAASFEHLDVERLVSLIHPENARSRAVAERLGMRDVGAERASLLVLRVYEARRG